MPPEPMAILDCSRFQPAPARVDRLVQEPRQALHLVRGQDPGPQHPGDGQDPQEGQEGQVTGPGAGHRHDAGGQEDQHHRGAQVRLEEHEADGQGPQEQCAQQAPGVERAAGPHPVGRQGQDEEGLHHLRRLQRQGPEAEPRLRPVAGGPEGAEHQHEPGQPDAVEQVRPPAEGFEVDHGRRQEDPEPERHPGRLPDGEHRAVAAGGRRDQDHPEAGERQHAAEQERIVPRQPPAGPPVEPSKRAPEASRQIAGHRSPLARDSPQGLRTIAPTPGGRVPVGSPRSGLRGPAARWGRRRWSRSRPPR